MDSFKDYRESEPPDTEPAKAGFLLWAGKARARGIGVVQGGIDILPTLAAMGVVFSSARSRARCQASSLR